jgi:uncharacterized protein (DUF4415 family)
MERLEAMTEEQALRNALDDPDNQPITPEFWEQVKLKAKRRKVPVYIRLDDDIVEFFKKEGDGYQSRINSVLRGYVDHCRRP